jgi:hypothetical protein
MEVQFLNFNCMLDSCLIFLCSARMKVNSQLSTIGDRFVEYWIFVFVVMLSFNGHSIVIQ